LLYSRLDLKVQQTMKIIEKIKEKLAGHHHDETVGAGAASGAATGMGLTPGAGTSLAKPTTTTTDPTTTTTTTTTGGKKDKVARWKPNSAYAIGDHVRYHGKVYEALVATTSSTLAPSMDTAGWKLMPNLKSGRSGAAAAQADSSSSSSSSDNEGGAGGSTGITGKLSSIVHH
jgi:hypothetical protein